MTVIDSTGDTVVARTPGDPPATFTRLLIEELRIAPAVDDTSLFTNLAEFVVDGAGRLWAYDLSTNSIFMFGPDGSFLKRVGRQGGGPGEFRSNAGMVALGDNGLALWDSQAGRISFFDSAGTYRTSWVTPTGFATVRGLVSDSLGRLYERRPIADPEAGDILGKMGLVRLGEDGVFLDSLAPPSVGVRPVTYTAVRESGGNRSSSSVASTFGPRPYGAWHPGGYFVVANGGTFEITLARSGEKPLVIRRDAKPVPVQDDERTDDRERVLFIMRRTDPDWSWAGPPIPEAKAPLQGLFVGRDGVIWARVATVSERVPEDELEPPPAPGFPVTRFRSPVLYERFDAAGRFLGQVPLERDGSLIEANGDLVWVLEQDRDGLPAIARYRMK